MSRIKKSFDATTGQVFTQWDFSGPRGMPGPWNHRLSRMLYSFEPPQPKPEPPAPLVDICVEFVVKHIDQVRTEHLQQLPVHVINRIWERIKQYNWISLETWKLLATMLAPNCRPTEDICPLLVNHYMVVAKIQPLAAFIEPLNSPTFDFLTHLTIASNVPGSAAELLQLVQLKNLAILEFIQVDTTPEARGFLHIMDQLTDSVLREWSTTPGAFPLLRVMRIWGNGCTTRHSLRYISAFPSLVLYDVAGEQHDWHFTDHSVWRGRHGTWKHHHFEINLHTHGWLLDRALIRDPRKRTSPGISSTIKNYFYGDQCWGFLMYGYIGRLLSNRDLSSQGLVLGETALGLGKLSLPPRPIVNVTLGPMGSDCSKLTRFTKNDDLARNFATQITFVRYIHAERQQEAAKTTPATSKAFKRPSSPQAAPDKIRAKKRLETSSLLDSFSKG
ncbi:hypothetical protein F5B22DRAFT_97406 [Xylaria bambusicola]|uniref:uncharacterized protein n=1 Tax=Xylaria bambusicola TaxID=326684 RepID=UPI002007F1FC|nr:uncharacterized protein F5B22DRAFT_97406 [Xylaria bambusicola]KAI0517750.1 hypothetical protein F5B22DRAFT_97406 [Xylaria bambusicola]